MVMKKNNSYRYPKTQREKIDGKRHYVFDKEKLPSVTTILDVTQSAEKRKALADWRASKGEAEATRIVDESGARGTAIHKGQDAIIDFKQTNKPKKREWIDDYFLQLSAYAMAHNILFNTQITKGVIMMCSKDNYYQEFVVEGSDFQKYKHNFLRRVDEYYKSRSKEIG
jgi:hypothetical protein